MFTTSTAKDLGIRWKITFFSNLHLSTILDQYIAQHSDEAICRQGGWSCIGRKDSDRKKCEEESILHSTNTNIGLCKDVSRYGRKTSWRFFSKLKSSRNMKIWYYYHLKIFKKYSFFQSFKAIAQKLCLPGPIEFWNSIGCSKFKFKATIL